MKAVGGRDRGLRSERCPGARTWDGRVPVPPNRSACLRACVPAGVSEWAVGCRSGRRERPPLGTIVVLQRGKPEGSRGQAAGKKLPVNPAAADADKNECSEDLRLIATVN